MASEEQVAKWAQEAHDQGQKDGAAGVYKAPYEGISELIVGRTEQENTLRDAYREGHDNGEKNPSKE